MKSAIKRIMGAGIAITVAAAVLAGCGQKQETEAEEYKQAGIGGLALLYEDEIWTPNEEGATESSLRFETEEEEVLGVSCSKESLYQHPLDMIDLAKQVYSTYENYEELEEPREVDVNGTRWYEWNFQYRENGETIKTLQRYSGENYYAYTISYLAKENDYGKNEAEALKVMNSAVLTVPDNEQAEGKAKEFLTGEWDLGAAGYLVLNQDGTYTWYMESSKDEANMHTGTYGCDIENAALGFGEGEGIYLVLFPQKLTAAGKEQTAFSAKFDYGISLEALENGAYQMVNVKTFVMYEMAKQ